MMYNPDYWKLVRILNREGEPVYKLFGTWVGGYTRGDEWRLNSGITKVEEDGDFLKVYGTSGSCYEVHNKSNTYRTSAYTGGVLGEFQQQLQGLLTQYTYEEALKEMEQFK